MIGFALSMQSTTREQAVQLYLSFANFLIDKLSDSRIVRMAAEEVVTLRLKLSPSTKLSEATENQDKSEKA